MLQKILNLLIEKDDYNTRLNALICDGSVEIKENKSGKYLYIRKRVESKITSTYVDKYNDDLYSILLRSSKEAKQIRKNISLINNELAKLGYKDSELDNSVVLNIDFAKANLKVNIYEQAVLEEIKATFFQVEDVLENNKVNNLKPSDVLKIINLKQAWQFILDKDVLNYNNIYEVLLNIARLVNQGFYFNSKEIRNLPVRISSSSYILLIPEEDKIKNELEKIINSKEDDITKAINLCLYCMKTQIFNDGNKRVAIILANYYLIKKGKGLLIIPEKKVSEFKKLLVMYYEYKDNKKLFNFMKDNCLSLINLD